MELKEGVEALVLGVVLFQSHLYGIESRIGTLETRVG